VQEIKRVHDGLGFLQVEFARALKPMASPRIPKHVSLATIAALAISVASIRAQDKPGIAGAPAAAPLGQPDANCFISLFNGKDLTGWEGLEGYWSVKNGVIEGSETKDHSVQTGTHLKAAKNAFGVGMVVVALMSIGTGDWKISCSLKS
jgi:hypothetical protein